MYSATVGISVLLPRRSYKKRLALFKRTLSHLNVRIFISELKKCFRLSLFRSPPFSHILLRLPLFSSVYLRSPQFTSVLLRSPPFSHILLRFPPFTTVYHSLPPFTSVYLRQLTLFTSFLLRFHRFTPVHLRPPSPPFSYQSRHNV